MEGRIKHGVNRTGDCRSTRRDISFINLEKKRNSIKIQNRREETIQCINFKNVKNSRCARGSYGNFSERKRGHWRKEGREEYRKRSVH